MTEKNKETNTNEEFLNKTKMLEERSKSCEEIGEFLVNLLCVLLLIFDNCRTHSRNIDIEMSP